MISIKMIIILAIILTCLLYLIISKYALSKAITPSDFLLYRKSLGAGKVFTTLYASGMSLATVFIAFFILAPYFGISLIWAAIFYSLGYFVLLLFIDKIFDRVKHGSTIHGFLGEAYDDIQVKIIASIATTVGFIGIFSTEIMVGSNILKDIMPQGVDQLYPILLFALIVIIYSLLGGFKSVIITDIYQSIATLVAILLIFIVALSMGIEDGHYFTENCFNNIWLPPLMMINFMLINLPFPLVDMSTWQRIAAVRNIKSAKKGVWVTLAMFLLTWTIILISALMLTENSSLDSSGGLTTSIISFAEYYGTIGIIVAVIIFPSLVAAMLSTADSYLVASGQTIIMDIKDFEYFKNHKIIDDSELKEQSEPTQEDRNVIKHTRHFMFIAGLSGIFAVVLLTKIGFKVDDLVFAVYGSSLALLPSVIFALLNKTDISNYALAAKMSILFGIIFGWVYGILSVLYSNNNSNIFFKIFASIDILPGKPSAYNSPTIALFVSTIIFILYFFMLRKRN